MERARVAGTYIHKDEMSWMSHVFSVVKPCTRQSKHELEDHKEGFRQTRNNLIDSTNTSQVFF